MLKQAAFRLDGFVDTFMLALANGTTTQAPNATRVGLNSVPTFNQPLGAGSGVWGAATLKWLIDNRSSRTQLNDIMWLATVERESGHINVSKYSPNVMSGPESSFIDGLPKDLNLCVSPAYAADRGLNSDKETIPTCITGFGSRQPGWWSGSADGYTSGLWGRGKAAVQRDAEQTDFPVSPKAYSDVYYALGCLPWWAQAIFAAMDIRIRSTKKGYVYLGALSPVDSDPTFKSSFYPYYMIEQPGLNNVEVKRFGGDEKMKRVEKIFVEEEVGKTLVDVLVQGVGELPSMDSPLFNAEWLTDAQWLRLVAGVSNAEVQEYNLAKVTKDQRIFDTTFPGAQLASGVAALSDLDKAGQLRTFCKVGHVILPLSDVQEKDRINISRRITLY